MNPAIPKNGPLSGMIIPALTAAIVLPLGLFSAGFRSHFTAPLSPAFQWTFLASIVAMALHKLESFWFEEYEQCPVYLTNGQAQWAQNPRKLLFLGFVPTFLGMMGFAYLGFIGPPWHLLAMTVWLGQGVHEMHHAAKSLSRRRAYPGIASSFLFVGVMWLGIFPMWHDLVIGARGVIFYGAYAVLPLVFLGYYLEDRKWTSLAPASLWRRTTTEEMPAVTAPAHA
jgi:hypothetical protein